MILIAEKGYYYTNGESFVQNVILPDGADPDVWKLVTEAEKEEALSSFFEE